MSCPNSKAKLRQASMTRQRLHTALASWICTRAGPMLPIGKNSSGSSLRHAARSDQAIALTFGDTSGHPRLGKSVTAATATRTDPVLRAVSTEPLGFFLYILVFIAIFVKNARVMVIAGPGPPSHRSPWWWPKPTPQASSTKENPHDVRDRPAMCRRQGQGLRRGVPG